MKNHKVFIVKYHYGSRWDEGQKRIVAENAQGACRILEEYIYHISENERGWPSEKYGIDSIVRTDDVFF